MLRWIYTRDVMSDGMWNVESFNNSLLLLTRVFTLQDKSGAQAGGTRSRTPLYTITFRDSCNVYILSQTFHIPSHIIPPKENENDILLQKAVCRFVSLCEEKILVRSFVFS